MTAYGVWLGIFLALCGTGIALVLVLRQNHSPHVVAWLGALAGLALIGLGTGTLFDPPAAATTLWNIPSLGDIVLRPDALSGLFLIVTGLVVLPGSIFAANSLPRLLGRYSVRVYSVMYFALLASIVWILLSGDVFSFFVAWEIMSILCYLLVNFEHEEEANRKAGYLMLAISEAGALAAEDGGVAAHAPSASAQLQTIARANLITSSPRPLARRACRRSRSWTSHWP